MTFQMIVLWTAVLIFIATLGFIGYSIYTSQYNISWPPSIPDCPDYWSVSSDGKNCNYGSYNKCTDAASQSLVIATYPNLCDKYDYGIACSNKTFNWSGVSNSLKCKK
jgi:hypothetical protein